MRVAIVDDHAMVREGIRLMLSGEDDIEIVAEAADGADLLAALATTKVDIVLLDLSMEGMGGLETLRHLRRLPAAPACIVLTMHDDGSFLRAAIELGAKGFVLKRSGKKELLRAMREVSDGGAHVDPHLAGSFMSLARSTGRTKTPHLSDEAVQLLRLFSAGLDNNTILAETGWTQSVLRARVKKLYETLEVRGRTEAVAKALRLRIIE